MARRLDRGDAPHPTLCAAALLGAVLAAAPAAARADEPFFGPSPGVTSLGHRPWADDCAKCHESRDSVRGVKCLDCHDHAPLRARIAAGKGLHAHPSVKKMVCTTCHTEHEGFTAPTVRWDVVGGEGKAFPHERTGWPLEGAHAAATCAGCHTEKWPISKRTKYVGASTDCRSCHAKDSPHAFKDPRAFACERCHGETAWEKVDPTPDFDHARDTSFPLTFKHAEKTCRDCHGAKLAFGDLTRTAGCGRCHAKDSPHKNVFAASDCARCHAVSSFKTGIHFNHWKETKFALTGAHARTACRSCHPDGTRETPSPTCKACHAKDDPHADRFASFGCADCHKPTGFAGGAFFDHEEKGGWKLLGAHAKAGCRKCHRGADKATFERFAADAKTRCADCHVHARAHADEPDLRTKDCLECHLGGGILKLKYDPHEGSPFHKLGGHAKVGCDGCHETRGYTGLTRDCVRCHEAKDPHEGVLGRACETCHGVPFKWAAKKFVHDVHTSYTLEGRHEKVACAGCHLDTTRWKPAPSDCVGCHRAQDVHAGRLGDRCESCHDTFGRHSYDHAKSASFPIRAPEKHSTLPCADCHKDRRFRPNPSRCADCHFDAHEGRYGRDCEGCHEALGWGRAAPLHVSGTFRLEGAHDELACGRCHTPERGALAGTGPFCAGCHREDDVHAGALGFECADCHTQRAWLPSTWSHAAAGFPLTGAHRLVACEKCHVSGAYGPLANDCFACHADDFMRVVGLGAGHPTDPDCARCHLTAAWRPWLRDS